jgi:hypothetical protein
MQQQQWEVLEHPPYSPDLAPSDFHLFGPLKHHLSAEHFPDDEAVEREVTAWFRQPVGAGRGQSHPDDGGSTFF